MAHDFLGNELSIGDYVVFLNYNGTSSNLESGIITRVSEHTAESIKGAAEQLERERFIEHRRWVNGRIQR